MQIVIEIDENVFTRLFDNGTEDYAIVNDDLFAIAKSIRNGTPLETQRPKGKWIGVSSYEAFGGDYEAWMAHENPIAYHYCSNCKEEAYLDEDGEEMLSDFCPFCGADMSGGGEE